ncbi:collagen-like protein [Candidatus Saccharibacteria bacterium]|nr:collagen-like protein [Candidatus Saccharibacteria bacterium]
MATETNKLPKTAKLIIGLLVVLVAVLFWLVLRQPAQQSNSLLGDNVSIRQDQDKIQWKLPGSDWQTITTVSELTAGAQGQPGKDGADGKVGANGKDGATGQDGADGQDGVDGAQGIQGIQGEQGTAGIDGQDGAQGAQGDQGVQGEQGEQGVQGVAGADGVDGQVGTDGTDGREIELQKGIYYIQWRYVGEPGWRNLIAYSDLKGDKGDKGDIGNTGPANTLSIGTVTKPSNCTPTATITGTAPNQTLNLGIPGLPSGGTTGQVLTKNSSADCDAIWANTNVIVGAGRPDIAGTMDAGTQAKVASATSGTEFRSTDGPQGAWVWMRQGSKWVVSVGDTGWRDITALFGDQLSTAYSSNDYGVYIRRKDEVVTINFKCAIGIGYSGSLVAIPVGFRAGGSSINATLPFNILNLWQTAGSNTGQVQISTFFGFVVLSNVTAGTRYYGSLTYIVNDGYPSTLPGTAI